jgi:hypothetical protein
LRDKLAAAAIELQQKDEIEMKVREIDELVSEQDRIVEVVKNGEGRLKRLGARLRSFAT